VIAIVILVALAAVSGFLLGQKRLRWIVMLAVAALLALLSAWVLQSTGVEAAIGIPVIVVSLTLYQGAYVLGLFADDDDGGQHSRTLPQQDVDKSPSDERDDDIGHKREWQYEGPSLGS
jgi:hypothetical protein